MSERDKDEELLTMVKPMTEKEKKQNLYVFQQLANEIANTSANYKDSDNNDIKTHLNVLRQLYEENLTESSIDDKQKRKKKKEEAIKPAALYGGKRKSKRTTRMKRKQLMCPKNCCGVPVRKCRCPKSCKHCNCHEIRRLRKKVRTCKKKKRRKKRTKKKRKRRRKKTRRRN
tara:strand:- start:1046 stop:1561 length:516 start_codon:yes stop_codon:yes gene_type:complete